MVLVGYNIEHHVFFMNFNYKTILLKRGVLVALRGRPLMIGGGQFLPEAKVFNVKFYGQNSNSYSGN